MRYLSQIYIVRQLAHATPGQWTPVMRYMATALTTDKPTIGLEDGPEDIFKNHDPGQCRFYTASTKISLESWQSLGYDDSVKERRIYDRLVTHITKQAVGCEGGALVLGQGATTIAPGLDWQSAAMEELVDSWLERACERG